MEGTKLARSAAATVALTFVIGGGTAVADAATAGAAPAPRHTQVQPTSQATTSTGTGEVLARHRAARTRSEAVSGRWSGALNTRSLASVRHAYLTQYASGLGVPTGFTGRESRCAAGTQSATSRAATQRAINFVRSLSGLAPVSFSRTLNTRSQYTALMMSANQTLSHSPGRSWRCYTRTGAANAGRSNLALWYPSITSAGVVSLYMRDPGASNRAVGHRRWLMNPFATAMGSGATNNANAITVIGPSSWHRPNPTYVSWPTPGYFPSTLEPAGRWSLSAGNSRTSFRRATVRVWRNGVRVHTVKNRVENGYAQPTLSWQLPASVARTGTFRVVVSGIRKGHRHHRFTRSYTVTMFNPGA